MAYERDPLSVRYDTATGALIGRAVAQPGTWVYVAVPRPRGLEDAEADSGGLMRWERAYQRSLYWVLNQGGNGARNSAWSLQREWGPVTGQGRLLGVRVSRPTTARRAVGRKPRPDQWWRNADQQSGGLGSAKQRFPA